MGASRGTLKMCGGFKQSATLRGSVEVVEIRLQVWLSHFAGLFWDALAYLRTPFAVIFVAC